MKIKTGCFMVMAVAVLAGCNDKKQDQMEARIKFLETNQLKFTTEMMNLTDVMQRGFEETDSNRVVLTKQTLAIALEVEQMRSGFIKFIDAFSQPATNLPIARSSQAVTFKEGVPIAVYNKIANDAAVRWKSDYEMQQFQIKNQIDAYKKLHP